ncbi:MAG: hypothetical protein QXO74_04475 [Candidatus Methanomethylicia archaeon]
MTSFRSIAECRGFVVKIPFNCWFSFFNSPYPAHKSSTALDVYYPEGEGLMPLDEGLILEVEKFECPVKRFDASNFDYLILIRCSEDVVLKILHVKPSVKPGEKVFLGDPLGRIIISGFLSPWSDIHMHLEFRDIRDPYRALGAFKLDISKTIDMLPKPENISNIFIVDEVFDYYVLLKPLDYINFQCGLTVKVDGEYFWVDGGIPHYDYGSILGFNGFGDVKYVNDECIGSIYFHDNNYSLFKPSCNVFLNGFKVKGVGSYIGLPKLKLILLKEEHNLKIGDIVHLNFNFPITKL